MKSQRLCLGLGYHDAAFLAIIKMTNRLRYFYLEINALYRLNQVGARSLIEAIRKNLGRDAGCPAES